MAEVIRYGVVGIKGMGQGHIRAIKEAPNSELAAVADIDEAAAKQCAQEHGVEGFADWRDMIAMKELDAVSICTPHIYHPEIAIAAMEAGKAVLTEKPMAVTVAEADRMIEAAQKTGQTLGVVYQHRFSGQAALIKRLMTEEVTPWYRAESVSTGMRTMGYYRSAEWRGTWTLEGGGVLINQAPHQLDIFQWYCGMPKRVMAWVRTLAHDIPVEDMVEALLEYESGAVARISCNTIDFTPSSRFEAWGYRAVLVADSQGVRVARPEVPGDEFIRTSEKMWGRPESTWETLQPEEPRFKGHTAVIHDFSQALLEGRAPLVPGPDGRNSVELANAIILSSMRGKVVELPVDREEYDDLLAELRAREKGQ